MPKLTSRFAAVFFATLLLVSASGCSIRQLAVKTLANAMASSGGTSSVFTSDDDPELIEDALPFALKTFELLLEEVPEHEPLLLATCQGFTQYAYAFIELDLVRLEIEDYRQYKHQKERALNMYLRARGYCQRVLELRSKGISGRLATEPERAVRELGKDDLELIVWTGSSWGSAIALGADQAELVADLPVVRELLLRAVELDSDYGDGLLHEAMVILESLPETMGGSPEQARHHFERALELSGGKRASTYVTYAELVSYGQQNREEFEELLHKALEIDPDVDPSTRLATLLTQKRARILLDLADDLFLE